VARQMLAPVPAKAQKATRGAGALTSQIRSLLVPLEESLALLAAEIRETKDVLSKGVSAKEAGASANGGPADAQEAILQACRELDDQGLQRCLREVLAKCRLSPEAFLTQEPPPLPDEFLRCLLLSRLLGCCVKPGLLPEALEQNLDWVLGLSQQSLCREAQEDFQQALPEWQRLLWQLARVEVPGCSTAQLQRLRKAAKRAALALDAQEAQEAQEAQAEPRLRFQ
ncbi:unnamed protein product, partial [Effrenium voratum]